MGSVVYLERFEQKPKAGGTIGAHTSTKATNRPLFINFIFLI